MILNNLKLANYKQYAALSLDFREGLVGMSGKNGAGKSTIFEAILYCLFGRDELQQRFGGWEILSAEYRDFDLPGNRIKSFITLIARKPSATDAT